MNRKSVEIPDTELLTIVCSCGQEFSVRWGDVRKVPSGVLVCDGLVRAAGGSERCGRPYQAKTIVKWFQEGKTVIRPEPELIEYDG